MKRSVILWLSLLAFAAWQGGFFFYAAVVVPTGTAVLDSVKLQGAITQQVTHWLNFIGCLALGLFLLDLIIFRASRGRWLTWLVMLIAQIMLLAIHPLLDRNFQADELSFTDRQAFRFWHATYLWTHTVQWLAALLWAWLSVRAWGASRADHA